MDSCSPLKNENKELRQQLEDAMQELHITKQHLALKQQMEIFLQEELEEEKRIKNSSVNVTEKSKEPELKKQIEELENELDRRDATIEQVKEQVTHLERALVDQINAAVSFSQQEQPSCTEQIFSLNEENEKLKELVSKLEMDIEKLKQEKAKQERENSEKDTIIEEIKCELASFANMLEKTRRQNIEQNMELEEMKMVTSKPAPKGNSLYAELDDRRIASEKKLAMLQGQLKTMQEKYFHEHKNNQKLKIQMIMMEPRGTDVDSEENRNLRLQIIRSNAEITRLLKKLTEYENLDIADKISEICKSDDSKIEKEKAFSDFLLAMLKNKEKELKDVKGELRSVSMMYWDENSKLVEQERELFLLEKNKKKLMSQIVQLNFRIEELQAKYEPEKPQASGGITEKIEFDVSDEETENSEVEIRESCGSLGFTEENIHHLTQSETNIYTLSKSEEDEITDEESALSDKENATLKETNNAVTVLNKVKTKKSVVHVPKKIQKQSEPEDCKVQ